MMKVEFEKLVGKSVPSSEYAVIEKVYTWHPSISNTEGKKQMATLYTEFGMAVIIAMKEGAEIAEKLDRQECEAVAKLNAIKERRKAIEAGDFQFEKCVNDVYEAEEESDTSEEYERMLSKLMNKYSVDLVNKARKTLGMSGGV